MAVGYHSRVMHAHLDPTSRATKHPAHVEVMAATDKSQSSKMPAGTERPRTLRQRTLSNKGESS